MKEWCSTDCGAEEDSCEVPLKALRGLDESILRNQPWIFWRTDAEAETRVTMGFWFCVKLIENFFWNSLTASLNIMLKKYMFFVILVFSCWEDWEQKKTEPERSDRTTNAMGVGLYCKLRGDGEGRGRHFLVHGVEESVTTR